MDVHWLPSVIRIKDSECGPEVSRGPFLACRVVRHVGESSSDSDCVAQAVAKFFESSSEGAEVRQPWEVGWGRGGTVYVRFLTEVQFHP